MANSQEFFDELDKLDIVLTDTYAMTGKLRETMEATFTLNNQLQLENDRLRARIMELEDAGAPKQSEAKLLEIYNSGIHVCHQYYGKDLEPGENCLLCQEVIYR